MSAVKHQPATPLPWGHVANQSPDFEPLPPVRIDYSTDDDGIHFEPQDFAYIHHAAHAYPKSIVAARSLAVVPNGIDKMSAADLRAHIREQSDRATALLRDLGEEA